MIVFDSVVVCHSRLGSIMSKKQDDIRAAEQRVLAVTSSYTTARSCLVQIGNATESMVLNNPMYTSFSSTHDQLIYFDAWWM